MYHIATHNLGLKSYDDDFNLQCSYKQKKLVAQYDILTLQARFVVHV